MGLAKTLLEEVQSLNLSGQYQEVINLLPDEMLQQYNDADLYAEKAQAYYRLDEFFICREMIETALGINPSQAKAHHYWGNLEARNKNYKVAIEQYTTAIKIDPELADPYNGLGIINYEQGDFEKAKEYYLKAISLNARYAFPYYNLGLVCLAQGNYEEGIAYCTTAININPQFADPFFSRAVAYEETGNYRKALTDYQMYVSLTVGKYDYYKLTAIARTQELEKILADKGYGDIATIVDNIKNLLLFSDGDITHYTSLSASKILMLNENSSLRLSEGAFLNDTSEGRELFTYLNFSPPMSKAQDVLAQPFGAKPFIGSFVAANKFNDLTLWRMYGKEEKNEACGCAITIDPQGLIDKIKAKLMPSEKKVPMASVSETFSFYKVAYRTQEGNFILPGADAKRVQSLNDCMQELSTKIKNLQAKKNFTTEDKQNILVLLNEIAYLFKTDEYQHEQELRLVLKGIGFEKKVDSAGAMPRVYIELVNIRSLIKKITIGPKVERGDEWAAAFYYSLEKDGYKPDICISHLPYK